MTPIATSLPLRPLQNPTPIETMFAKSFTKESEDRRVKQIEASRAAITTLKAQGKW